MNTDITKLSGFDQTAYDNLAAQYAKATGKTSFEELDVQLLAAFEKTSSFSEAVNSVRAGLPPLPVPIMERDITSCGVLPSFGSNYLALITELASKQRQQNAEMRALQTEEMIDKIQEQAETIKNKAITQLVTGIVSGTLSIAQGIASTAISAKGISEAGKAADAARTDVIETGTGGGTVPVNGKAALDLLAKADDAATMTQQQMNMALNNRVTMFNSAMQGGNSILGSIGQYVASTFDVQLKEQEGDVEQIRAMQQRLESLDESLKELIRKSLSSQDAIQQNMNQTRTKILG